MKAYKTLKQRIKDKHINALLTLARETNFVFNYVNNLSYEHTRRTGKFFSAFDIANYTKGCAGKYLGEDKLKLHSQTVQAISEQYVQSRKQFKKSKLNWRVSNRESSRYSLGWIPFKSSGIQVQHGQIKYGGIWFSIWDSYKIDNYKDKIKSGCFVEDSRGRWYVSLVVEVETKEKIEVTQINKDKTIAGDLGYKTYATITNGTTHVKIEATKNYRQWEDKLAIAQRAKKKDREKSIHIKIKNKRKDELHKLSSQLVKENQAIFMGNISAEKLAKSNKDKSKKDKKLNKKEMNKSAYDAGFSMVRSMLEYKCNIAGIYYLNIDESYTTQTCSCCGARNGPKGSAGLGIREWTCACGTTHDRDINAAINILVRGHAHLAGGISIL
jgi:putative transposase